MGLAVEHDRILLDWRTRSFSGHWSDRKCKTILRFVDRFVTKHQVEGIAIKIPHPSHHSDGLTELLHGLENYFKDHRCLIYRFTVYELKNNYHGPGSSRDAMIATIVKKRPELTREYHKEIKSRKKYYAKMFEAVACIHLAYDLWTTEGR